MTSRQSRFKVLVVFGTRPEAIKVAPVIWALRRTSWCEVRVLVTAQHRELLDQVLVDFEVAPDHDLGVMRQGQSVTHLVGRLLSALEPIVTAEGPDALLVQGDTASTLAGAFAGFYTHAPVIHLEAGLRSHDRGKPFPEEMNRRLVSRMSSLHLVPTPANRELLIGEGVERSQVVVTGNTVIDALHHALALPCRFVDPVLREVDASGARLVLVTCHRRESWGRPTRDLAAALVEIAASFTDVVIVLPVHPNPVLRSIFDSALGRVPRIHVVDPLPYVEFAHLLSRSYAVLTDSGGIQEEAPALGKPVLIFRSTTERTEATTAGVAEVIGTGHEDVVLKLSQLLSNATVYQEMARVVSPFGDGLAAERTVAAIGRLFGLDLPLSEFAISAG